MSCEVIREQLHTLPLNELEPIREHLDGCLDCQGLVRLLADAESAIDLDLADFESERAFAGAWSEAETEPSTVPSNWRFPMTGVFVAIAAAASLLLALQPGTDVGPAPAVVPDCGELQSYEAKAMAGSLEGDDFQCVSDVAYGTGDQRGDATRVLLAHHWTAGEMQAWQTEARRYLDEIDASDPDLAYKFALHLLKQGDDEGAIAYADLAIEAAAGWTDESLASKRVYGVRKIQASAAQKLWRADVEAGRPADESRARTLALALDWLESAADADKDGAKASELCLSAGGTSEECASRGAASRGSGR